MPDSTAAGNRAIVERYFELMQSGDPAIAELFAADACWVAPQSSPMGRMHAGRDRVLALMSGGIELYDPSKPMDIDFEAIAAEGDRVFVEMTMAATTAAGEPYRNHYVFVFTLRDGRIVEVHEHLDTLYTQRLLFDPVGRSSPVDERD